MLAKTNPATATLAARRTGLVRNGGGGCFGLLRPDQRRRIGLPKGPRIMEPLPWIDPWESAGKTSPAYHTSLLHNRAWPCGACSKRASVRGVSARFSQHPDEH